MTIQLTNDGGGDVEVILQRAADPAGTATKGKVYTKAVAGVTQLWYVDSAGIAYQLTPSATPGDTPWLRTGTDVRLDQTGDTLVTPFDDNSTDIGLQSTVALTRRWKTVITGSNGLWTYGAAGDANRTSFFGQAGLAWGPGGATALDAGMQRIGVARMALSSGDAGGAGGLFPFVDAAAAGGATAHLGESALRWRDVSTSKGFLVYAVAADANPTTNVGGASVSFGAGGATPVDVRLRRSAALILTLDDGAGGGIGILPAAGINSYIGDGATAFYTSITGNQINVWDNVGDANPSVRLNVAGQIYLGPGGATAPDVRMQRTAVKEMTIDDTAAGAVDVVPGADNIGRLGTTAKRWNEVNAFTVTTGDVVFTDPGCPYCGQEFAEGDEIVFKVIKTTRAPDGGPLTRTVPCHHGCK